MSFKRIFEVVLPFGMSINMLPFLIAWKAHLLAAAIGLGCLGLISTKLEKR